MRITKLFAVNQKPSTIYFKILIRLTPKKRIGNVICCALITVLLLGCSDSTKKFIGKHTINIPLLIKTYDFSKKIMVGGEQTNPEVHYIELYTSSVEFYRTDEGKLSGQFKYVRPENDKYKIYAHELTISEDNFELKNMRMVNDTLYFAIPVQNMFFDGWISNNDGQIAVGIPKKMFSFIHARHCTEDIMKESAEYFCFIADQPINKRAIYQCQVDSLKKFLDVNPKFIPKWEVDIDFLNNLAQ